jgi:hypothetical protein
VDAFSLTPDEAQAGADYLGKVGTRLGKEEAPLRPSSRPRSARPRGTAVQSIEQNAFGMAAALVTGNPLLAIVSGSAMQGGTAYEDAREAGKSPAVATAFGAGQAGAEAAGELLPMHVLFGDLHAGSTLWKTLGHQIITEVPTEEATQHLQDLNEWLTLHPEKTLGDYLREEPDRVITTALATMVQAGVVGTAMHGAGKALGMAQGQQQQAQAATEQAQGIEQMMKAAEASKLRQRDPQTFQQYVDHVTADTPAEFVYISANDLVNTLAQGSPEQIAQNAEIAKSMPSVPGQLSDALPSNGLVRIPISELLAYTPETPLAQSLIEHLKVDPEGYSMKEAEAFMQSKAEDLKTEVGKAVEQGLQQTDFEASTERVKQAIIGEISKTGRYTKDAVETMALLPTSMYATMAAKMGVLPEAVHAAHTLQVQAAGVGPDALAQAEVDKALPGVQAQTSDQGVLFPVLPVQLPTESDGAVRIENAFGGYNPGALNYAQLNRDQVRTMNTLHDQAKFTTEEVPLADLVVTQRTVNADFPKAGRRKKGDGYDLPAVYKVNGRYVLADGHHRATAALAEGKTTVEARVYNVDAAITSPPLYQEGPKAKLTPAVKLDGKVYKAQPGDKTHLDVWFNRVPKELRTFTLDGGKMGYIDHRGRFLDRARAWTTPATTASPRTAMPTTRPPRASCRRSGSARTPCSSPTPTTPTSRAWGSSRLSSRRCRRPSRPRPRPTSGWPPCATPPA